MEGKDDQPTEKKIEIEEQKTQVTALQLDYDLFL